MRPRPGRLLALPGTLFVAGLAFHGIAPALEPTRAERVADAAALYNAGTLALSRGEPGPAVAFLTAAARLEPRAPDIRANLARALASSARSGGNDPAAAQGGTGPMLLSAREAWWLASGLVAIGSALGIAGALRRRSQRGRGWARGLPAAGALLLGAGVALGAFLFAAAREEAAYPEAVVIAATLSVERGPDEPPRPEGLLGAGERVRLGSARGSRVEIRIGGSSVGWAARAGLWRVADAPRYTSPVEPR